MMRKCNVAATIAVMGILLLCINNVLALPIPGSSQELTNPGFETGDFTGWTTSGPVQVGTPGHTGDFGAGLRGTEGQSGQIGQVVDDKQNPLWNDDYNQKIVDLSGWVVIFSGGKISFRLDYWKDIGDQPPITPADFVTDWVSYDKDSPGINPATYSFVNPFNRILWDFQPRWISLEIDFKTPQNVDAVGVDDLQLTAKCVPEPSTLLLLGSSLISLVSFKRNSILKKS